MRLHTLLASGLVAAALAQGPVQAQSLGPFGSPTEWVSSLKAPEWAQSLTEAPGVDTVTNLLGVMSNPKMMQAMMQMGDPELIADWMEVATNAEFLNLLVSLGNASLLRARPVKPGLMKRRKRGQ